MMKRQNKALMMSHSPKRLRADSPLLLWHGNHSRCKTFEHALQLLHLPVDVAKLVSEFEQEVITRTHTYAFVVVWFWSSPFAFKPSDYMEKTFFSSLPRT